MDKTVTHANDDDVYGCGDERTIRQQPHFGNSSASITQTVNVDTTSFFREDGYILHDPVYKIAVF